MPINAGSVLHQEGRMLAIILIFNWRPFKKNNLVSYMYINMASNRDGSNRNDKKYTNSH